MNKRAKQFLLIALTALLVAFLFRNPMTRAVLLWILPLGSGIDDLIEIIALIFAVVFGLYFVFTRKQPI